MLVAPDGQLPIIAIEDDKPVWQSAEDAASSFGTSARLTGLHGSGGDITLTLDADEIDNPQRGTIWIPADRFRPLP